MPSYPIAPRREREKEERRDSIGQLSIVSRKELTFKRFNDGMLPLRHIGRSTHRTRETRSNHVCPFAYLSPPTLFSSRRNPNPIDSDLAMDMKVKEKKKKKKKKGSLVFSPFSHRSVLFSLIKINKDEEGKRRIG